MRRDFDRQFAEHQRSARRMRQFIFAMNVVVIALSALFAVGAVYAFVTVSPEQIGDWLGRLSRAFEARR